MAAGGQGINQALVVACVEEFFTTVTSARRAELDRMLNEFKTAFSCADVISSCIGLMDRSYSSTVQLFGAISLYETVKHRSDECISTENLMESLKKYLIDSLTCSAAGRCHTVIQKLQSTLALLALYSIPDVWAQPVQDLTLLWSAFPELLLRVLAEIAAEFSNVHMPLTQRSVLKTELHRISEEIILVIKTVLNARETDPSLRQAAVECVERWVQLPGIGLQQWTEVLSNVFGAVTDDSAALTNLLNILADNEELSNLEQLVLDICGYITKVTAKKIETELRENSDSDEACTLIAAVCRLAERAVPNLIRDMRSNQGQSCLTDLCQMFVTLSNWPGRYPVDERVSDLPSVFWTFLRESVMDMKSDPKMQCVVEGLKPMYSAVCKTAASKLAYPPLVEYEQFDKEQRDAFINYRKTRSEVSVDAFYIEGTSTLIYLNKQLEEALQEGNICRIESILYLWHLVADYTTEDQYLPICHCLELCTQLANIPTGKDCDRLGCSLMQLFVSLAHLIQAHDNAVTLQNYIVNIILPYMDRPVCAQDALVALENIISTRNEDLFANIGNEVSEKCYNFFMDTTNAERLRLMSLKCIGFILSTKNTGEVMEIVQRLISSHVQDLTVTGTLNDDVLLRKQFQINIFSSLFSTLNNKNSKLTPNEDSPVILILQQAMPVFRSILTNQGAAKMIGDRVCEAVRSAVCSFSESSLSICRVFPSIAEIIDLSLITNSATSCSLAKSTVLTYAKSQIAVDLCKAISKWFELFAQHQDHNEIEEWLGLIYHVMKKNWKTLHSCENLFVSILNNAIFVAGNALVNSNEPNVVKVSSQVLAEIASQTTSFDDNESRQLLAQNGTPIVKHIFQRVQSELLRTTVESLAEVLFFFVKQFPSETRSVINTEERGDSPMVAAMFREVGNLRNFKQMTFRLNQACRKSN